MTKPLSGYTVLVTRPPKQAPALQRLIEAQGGVACNLPLINTVRLSDHDEQARKLESSSWDWIVFTSANAVSFFEEVLQENGIYLQDNVRIASVGTKTANMLKKNGRTPDLVPEQFSAEGLANLLKSEVRAEERVLFPKSARARAVIPSALEEIGAAVTELPLYTSVPAFENKAQLQEWLNQGEVDILTFTSPSAVKAFVSFLKETSADLWQTKPVVSIGSVTDNEVQQQGFTCHKTAYPYTIEGLVRSVTNLIKEENQNE
ncbi:uroporphyrinogen-III synthase [Salibacterium salarium]|uniref:Uroporphyrinogen-III synthase n=1 Tax=Salibacterium salarium TaxID=284579 RepID=A0A3R9P4G3_9BACI|nr:uroporphyrinogen-III synthase [Salibacterium salarium]RSL32613.1 uroporphyrinogen-III synthase [Salibacterium salarium]